MNMISVSPDLMIGAVEDFFDAPVLDERDDAVESFEPNT